MNLNFNNWSENHSWKVQNYYEPRSKNELLSTLSKLKGKKFRIAGSLHSFSDCVSTDNNLISMKYINKVISVDLENNLITYEAGVKLAELYTTLNENSLAIINIPNVDEVTLGGAITNCTHGTGLISGTLCDSVQSFTIITVDGDIIECSRPLNSEDDELFNAGLVSLGSLGVIYTVTLKTVPTFNTHVMHRLVDAHEILPDLAGALRSYDSVNLQYLPIIDMFSMKVKTIISPKYFKIDGLSNVNKEKYLADISRRLLKGNLFSNQSVIKAVRKISQLDLIKNFYSWNAILGWDTSELIKRKVKFVNMEYGIDMSQINSVFVEIMKICDHYEPKGYKRYAPIVLRPIQADSYGYLSPTKGRDTTFIDMSMQYGSEIECSFFRDIEEILLQNSGRVSWSRVFFSDHEKLSKAYPDFDKFDVIRQRFDPKRQLENNYIKRIFYK